MNTTTEVAEGTQVATVGRDGARTAGVGRFAFPIWTGKVYTARRTLSGRLTWRLTSTFGGTTSGNHVSDKFVRHIRELATEAGLEFSPRIVHGMLAQ